MRNEHRILSQETNKLSHFLQHNQLQLGCSTLLFKKVSFLINQAMKLQNWAPSTSSIESDQTSLLKLDTACLYNNKISRSYTTYTKKLGSRPV